jgi:hypothetical protein
MTRWYWRQVGGTLIEEFPAVRRTKNCGPFWGCQEGKSMVTMLEVFDAKLREATSMDEHVRPFVCEGSPLDSQIFIVGFNPATEVEFWRFWSALNGFDKQEWLKEYRQQRAAAGKDRPSNTRRAIEWIVEAARPVRCLETNLHCISSRKEKDLAPQWRSTAIFDFLLETIRPPVILVHGKKARTHLQGLLRCCEIELWKARSVSWGSRKIIVYAGPHLSRGWSEYRAREVGTELSALCHKGR